MSPFELFENLISSTNEKRQQAEKSLSDLKLLPFSDSFKVFSEGMTSTNANIFQLTTLMLKKFYLNDAEMLQKLTPEQIEAIKALIKGNINLAYPWKSLQHLGDCLAILYKHSNLSQGFAEIMIMFNNQNSLSRQLALYIIELICELKGITEELIKSSLKEFLDIFSKGLNDENVSVKVRSVFCVLSLLNNLTNEDVINEFKSLRDPMLGTLIAAIKEDDKSILNAMQMFIEKYPKFWKEKMELIIDIVCQIAKETKFPNTVKESALELVYSFAKNLSGLMKKSPNFNNMFIPLMFELSLQIDNIDNMTKWEKETEENDSDKDELFYGVIGGFERMGIDLGGKYFMEATAPYVKKYLQSTNWIEIHSAYMIMGKIAEGCKESYKAHLQETLNFISIGLANTNPRIRYAALTAFSLILKETSPIAQQKFTNNILPALAQLMGNKETSLRVKGKSCFALSEFLRGLVENKNEEEEEESEELLKPYIDDLVKLITSLFEESLKLNYAPLQEYTLASFALLANILNKQFASYYNYIIPGLKKLFYSFNSQPQSIESQQLHSNCIETISFLCSSISECSDQYMNDLNELSQAFMNYLLVIKQEDPQFLTLLNSFSHFSLAMKESFVPILNNLIPVMNPLINANIGIKCEDNAIAELMPQSENSKEDTNSVLVQIGSDCKKLSLNTFALQNKISAYNVFNDIAHNMKTHFFPYVEQLLKLALELIKYPFSMKIRKISIKAVYSCLNACPSDNERSKVLLFIETALFEEFQTNITKRRIKEIKTYLKTLLNIVKLVKTKTAFTEQFIMKLYQSLQKLAQMLSNQKKAIISQVEIGKKEEDNEDLLLEDYEELNEYLRQIMEISSIVFKLFGEQLTALVTQSLFQIYSDDWQAAIERKVLKSDQEICSAICFFNDYMEYSDISAFNLVFETFIHFSYSYQTKNEDIIQAVINGYGIICQRISKEGFNQFKDKLATAIIQIIQKPVNEDNECTFDHAIGAMGKLIYYQCNNDDNGKAMSSQFIKLLPLKNDLDESKKVCRDFFYKIKENHPLIVTDTNIPLIKEAIIRINELNKDKFYLEEEEIVMKELASKLGLVI